MASAREIVICVDIGMTGSGKCSHWPFSNWSSTGWIATSKLKILTKIAYGLNNIGPPIAWGSQCNGLPSAELKECFKTFMGAATFSNCHDDVPGGPGSQLELHQWFRDYLRAFCADTVAIIDLNAGPAWRAASIIWNFTVPGSWAEFPVVADFKRLAEDAVSSCLPNSKDFRICTDVTEGYASSQCLLVEGSIVKEKQFSVGNVIISCDIGGATTDVAISKVSSTGRLTTSCPKLEMDPAGTVAIEKAFWLYVTHMLRSAGAQNPHQLALDLARSPAFLKARSDFVNSQSEEYLKIQLPYSFFVRDWSPQGTPSITMATIEDCKLCIPRDVFESFFIQFIQQIETAIDEAINTAEKAMCPTVIGFCGGGSNTAYAMNRLRSGYGEKIPIIDPNQLAIRPEMATVTGSTLLWDQKKLQEFIGQTSFGIETVDEIEWMLPEESIEPSKFSRPYVWVFSFTCRKRGNTNLHRIIVLTSPPVLPRKISDGLPPGNSRIWTVRVDLRKEKGATLTWSRKYKVICNIARPWEIDFRVESLLNGRVIPCTVIGVESHE